MSKKKITVVFTSDPKEKPRTTAEEIAARLVRKRLAAMRAGEERDETR